METQHITPDKSGQYTVRWLAVQVSGESEQPRVLLVVVPYALKAAAETVGGLPPSAFVLAAPVVFLAVAVRMDSPTHKQRPLSRTPI
jgi:hypothetical protein